MAVSHTAVWLLHFGLGPGVARVARVRVTWPASGRVISWHAVPTNQTFVLGEKPAGCGLGGAQAGLAPLAVLGLRRRRRRAR